MVEQRIFDIYKKELKGSTTYGTAIRFLVIEYLCSFPGIDPVEMAKALISEGYDILFDDSSISRKENMAKRAKVYGKKEVKQ